MGKKRSRNQLARGSDDGEDDSESTSLLDNTEALDYPSVDPEDSWKPQRHSLFPGEEF